MMMIIFENRDYADDRDDDNNRDDDI